MKKPNTNKPEPSAALVAMRALSIDGDVPDKDANQLLLMYFDLMLNNPGEFTKRMAAEEKTYEARLEVWGQRRREASKRKKAGGLDAGSARAVEQITKLLKEYKQKAKEGAE